jgi:hypothetical protein
MSSRFAFDGISEVALLTAGDLFVPAFDCVEQQASGGDDSAGG